MLFLVTGTVVTSYNTAYRSDEQEVTYRLVDAPSLGEAEYIFELLFREEYEDWQSTATNIYGYAIVTAADVESKRC